MPEGVYMEVIICGRYLVTIFAPISRYGECRERGGMKELAYYYVAVFAVLAPG